MSACSSAIFLSFVSFKPIRLIVIKEAKFDWLSGWKGVLRSGKQALVATRATTAKKSTSKIL